MLFFLKKCIIYYKAVMLLERENVIMKKTRKIIMSLFAGICTAILIATSASATYNSTGKSFTNNEGGFFASVPQSITIRFTKTTLHGMQCSTI